MDQSPAHTDAVFEAVRVPALEARLDMLAQGAEPNPARIDLFADPTPAEPGDPPSDDALASINLTASVGTVTDEVVESVRVVKLVVTTPLEGQVTDADPVDGSIPTWARIYTPDDEWWADVTVSVEGEGGELQMVQTGVEDEQPVARLFNGAFARISSFVIEG